MSKIPYYFDTPLPKYFRENGWLKNVKARAFICFCFERISFDEREIQHDGQRINLKPFQFIFGRRICSQETGLTEDEVRTQQISMEKATFLKKCPNKTPNRFTIYEMVSEAFTKECPQQNPQQTPNRPPTDPHNLAYKKFQNSDIKESALSASAALPFPKEDRIEKLADIARIQGLVIPNREFKKWLKHSDEEIIFCLSKLKKQKNVDNPAGWMQTALKKNYAGEQGIIKSHKEYAEQFKHINGWTSLTITQKYCRDENTGKDLYFMNPNFKDLIESIYIQTIKEEICLL